MKARTGKNGVKFDYVETSKLRFDPTNPRFAAGGAKPDQDQIQQLLEKEPHFALELVASLLENGFIDYEPLVVRAQNDSYTVVEGNRRLAAIRHILASRQKYESQSTRLDDLEEIPVLIFAEMPTQQREKEQRVYLGVRHLFGFREWPPESKARYLDGQVKTDEDLERVSKELNVKRQDVQRYLVPFRLRKAAGKLWDKHKDQDFWILGEGLNRAGIKAYINLDVDRGCLEVKSFDRTKLVHLLRFIYGTPAKDRADRVVKETRHLSSLAKVLQNKKAAAALEKGRSLADASVLLESESESKLRLKELLRECHTILKRFKSDHPELSSLTKAYKQFAEAANGFLRHVG